ncbi:TlpA family protein disulfide reductase [Candidatus Omnitrophota bacterium]
MRGCLKLLLLPALIFLFTAGCIGANEPVSNADHAPDFTLQDLNNEPVSLGSFKGKAPVLLFFWASWCPSCRRGFMELSEASADLKEEGLEILAVNIGESNTTVERFIDDFSCNCRVLLDKNTAVAGIYKIVGIPTFILINKEGRIISKGHKFLPEKFKELISEL